MLSCKQASELLSHAHDRRLHWRERFALKLHLMLCSGCANFRRQLDFMRAAIRRCRDHDQAP